MKKSLSFLIISLFLFSSQLLSQIVDTHEFGSPSSTWWIYPSGKTWEFAAQNDMVIQTIDVKSVLEAYNNGGTFHISVYIEGSLIASWDQNVSNTTPSEYYHSKEVNLTLLQGDSIQYKISGGTYSTPVGGISGINYIKLTGSSPELQFSSLSEMHIARFGFGYTDNGSSIYAVSGGRSVNLVFTSLEKYTIATNTWEYVSGLLPRMLGSAEYVSGTGKIYVFNGRKTYSPHYYTDTVEIIDDVSGTISYSASNPYPVEEVGSAVWDSKIYVFGGSNDNEYSKRLYEYNPITDTWVQLQDMPEAKETKGTIVDGVLYVFGGRSEMGSSDRIDAYNIQNASWTSLGTMPIEISQYAVTKSGLLIWIVGSAQDGNLIAVYNTESNQFMQVSSNMTRRKAGGAAIIGQNLYVFGGTYLSLLGGWNNLNNLDVADISSYLIGIEDTPDKQQIVSHNYPNPFRQSTIIAFTLSKHANTTITVFNQAGQKIKPLFDGSLIAGDHNIQFDGSDLPAGIYFYTIHSGKYSGTGKMLLLK